MKEKKSTIRLNFWKKSFAISIAVFFLSVLPANAQFEPYNPQNPNQQLLCRGDRDWATFISATLSYDGFTEYWKDITVRYSSNICHYQDIQSVQERLVKVRAQLRDAFIACTDTTQLKKTYYETEAELFFLRKYIDADNGNFLVTPSEEIIKELRDFFVINKGYFTDQQITALYEKFQQKYTSRLEIYRQCKDTNWEALVEKWNEFKETVGGLSTSFKRAQKSIERSWDRMANTPLKLGSNFIGGFDAVRINGLPSREGWERILQTLQKNSPQGVTFQQLQAATEIANQNANDQALESEYLQEYKTLYQETSDQFTTALVNNVSNLNGIIKTSFTYQNQTLQCVKSVVDKEC